MKASRAAEDMIAASDKKPTNLESGAATNKFNYEGFYYNELDKKHKDKSYRYFNNINRLAQEFPRAHTANKQDKVTVWCSNDYVCCLYIEFT